MNTLQEIELNRRIERYRSAVTAHILNKSTKTTSAVAQARLQLTTYVMQGGKS